MENKKWYVGQKVYDKTVSNKAGKIINIYENFFYPIRVQFTDFVIYYDLSGTLELNKLSTLSTTPYEIKMEGFSQEVEEEELPKIGDVCWSKIDKNEDWAITHFLRKQSTHYLVSSTNSEKDSYPCNFITTKNPYENSDVSEMENTDREPQIGDMCFFWDEENPKVVVFGKLNSIVNQYFKYEVDDDRFYKHCSLKNPLIK